MKTKTCKTKPKITCTGLQHVARDLKDAEKIKFYFGRYGPDWYQELSDRQMSAADECRISVAEDIEQGTVHRCQRILRGIGIKPIVSAANIRLAQTLSRGNDIAFLWFLLQMFYISPPSAPQSPPSRRRQYSLNERILFSAIAHLNMITTLRELDRRCCPRYMRPPKPLPEPVRRPPRIHYASPYLEPIPCPVIPVSHRLPKPILPGPCFEPYDVYANAAYVVDNEDSRWYAANPAGIPADDTINPDPLACHCMDVPIMDEMFPLPDDDGVGERPAEFYEQLLDEFRAATKCYCGEFHVSSADAKCAMVHPSQLDASRTRAEYRQLLAEYKVQLMVVSLVKCLLFEAIPRLDNVRVCINCRKCETDYDRLVRLMEQNARQPYKATGYELHIRKHLFGPDGAVGLLRRFNEIADRRSIVLDVCVKDVWQYELRLWSDVADEDGGSSPAMQQGANDEANRQCSPDPNDAAALDRELIEVLRQMRAADPKFVLACLPEANKVPLLCEWLRVRYGLVYTRKVREIKLLRTRRQWLKLDRGERLRIRALTPNDVCGKCNNLDYSDMVALRRCLGPLRAEYVHRLNVALINDARRLWPTMEPFLCTSGPPRKLFYAYLAGCEYDITADSPWELYDKKDMVLWTKPKMC